MKELLKRFEYYKIYPPSRDKIILIIIDALIIILKELAAIRQDIKKEKFK